LQSLTSKGAQIWDR